MKKLFALIPALVIVLSLVAVPAQPAHACGFFGLFCTTTSAPGATGTATTNSGTCGSTKTQLISCNDSTGVGAIGDLIKFTIIILSILVGIVAAGGIAFGAILYATARDSQVQLDQSKTIIRNVILGLIFYGFTIVILNWLMPNDTISTPTPATTPSTSPLITQSATPTSQP